MSMSTHVVGFIPPDETFRKMQAVWDACREAGIDPPREVLGFFGYREPDESGREVELDLREFASDMAGGYELDLETIPPGVKSIRFWSSW